MRLYQVKSENKVRYVAAHNSHKAGQISKFKKITTVEEINISEPVLLLEICQEITQTEKSDSTSGK